MIAIDFPLELDGVREDDRAFQQEIDRTIRSLYAEFGVTTITIAGPFGSRVDNLLSLVAGLS